MKHIALTSAVMAFSFSGAASAATFTLSDVANPDPVVPTEAEYNALPTSFSLTSEGISVEVSAKSYSFISAAATEGGIEVYQAFFVEDHKIGRFENGAGVFDSFGDAGTVESSALTVFEFIQLTFSEAVTITNLAFGGLGKVNNAYNIIEDRSGDNAFGAGDFISLDQEVGASVPVSGFGTMTTFGVLAPGPYASFQLQSVTVEPATVPLPAGLAFMITGVAGLAALRRKGASA